jgi:polyvinyl alcohol dehydrogenase (cytochrome)
LAVFSTVTALGGYAAATQADVGTGSSMQWPVYGGSPLNKGYAPSETKLSPATVPNLKQEWVFTTHGAVPSTPTVDGNYLYVTDFGGYVYKIDRTTGKAVWSVSLPTYTKKNGSYSRSAPALTDTLVIVGDMAAENVIALNKSDGSLKWLANIHLDGPGHVTNSPMVYNNVVYAGTASYEEGTALFEGKKGPTFRGSVWALNASDGSKLWSTATVPTGYTGGGVWSSPMVVDAARGSLYATTGDNYTLPSSVSTCLNTLGQNQNPQDPAVLANQLTCISPQDYVDSVVAFDLNTGNVKWARRLQGADSWDAFCLLSTNRAQKKCSFSGGQDWDFGAGPNLIDATINGQHKQLLGAGEKNGIYWALDPDTGATVWSKLAGPPDLEGGIEWGAATDDQRIYFAEVNFAKATFTLQPSGTSWNNSALTALDAATGNILWQTTAPSHRGKFGQTMAGALSVANGVLYTGTGGGYFLAVNAQTGKILWQFQSGGAVICAPSVIDGHLYWGSGYVALGKGNNQLYAFTVP